MQLLKEYYAPHLERAYIDQLTDQLRNEGYEVSTEVPLGTTVADLVAEKNDEKIIYEIRTGSSNDISPAALVELQQTAQKIGATFRLVFAHHPPRYSIEVKEVPELLVSYLNENLPNRLARLSTCRVEVASIPDFVCDTIRLTKAGLHLSGYATMEIRTYEEENVHKLLFKCFDFPFTFSLLVELHDGAIRFIESPKVEVDTSSYDAEVDLAA